MVINVFEGARLWKFHADMNYDEIITVSDAWLWVKWFYFYPGDLLLSFIASAMPSVAKFFEISYASFGNWFSFYASLISWVIIYILIAVAYADFKK